MMNSPAKILLVEDDPAIVITLHRVLAGEGYEVSIEKTGDSGLARAKESAVDLVITDLKLPGLNGLDLVRELHAARPRLPILMITAHGTTESAIEATQSGAYDYLLKPFDIPELLKLVEDAVAASRLMSEPVQIGVAGQSRDAIVGNSRSMQAIYKEIGRIAAKPVSVLIRGETGTGKELIARAIYQHSDRANEPFVAINCAAIPETLLESELFGHERGAFTGAESRRIGRFEQADKGTIFLDEIGDMTPATQVKLVRVLQEKCLQRVGGKETIPVDVRVIAATHRDLESAIKQNLFREDLFYRLSVVVLSLPPLRERKEDIEPLAKHLLARLKPAAAGSTAPRLSPEAAKALSRYRFPGNIRELENILQRALVLCAADGLIRVEHLPTELDAARGSKGGDFNRQVEGLERRLLVEALREHKGSQSGAAKALGLSRTLLIYKLKKFKIAPASYKSSAAPKGKR